MAKSLYMNDTTKPEVINLVSQISKERRLSLLKTAELLLLEAGTALKNYPKEYSEFMKQYGGLQNSIPQSAELA